MFERLQRLLDRIESRIALWTIVQGSGVMTGGIISGWIAYAEEWIGPYGALGWWFAGLLGALLTASIFAAFGGLRLLWVRANLMRHWGRTVSDVNPLKPEYNMQRVAIQSIAHPATRAVERKRFTDCDIVGPANIVVYRNVLMSHVSFINCDVVVVKPIVRIHNGIRLEDITIFGGSISECTIMVPPAFVEQFGGKANFITSTGVSLLDEAEV